MHRCISVKQKKKAPLDRVQPDSPSNIHSAPPISLPPAQVGALLKMLHPVLLQLTQHPYHDLRRRQPSSLSSHIIWPVTQNQRHDRLACLRVADLKHPAQVFGRKNDLPEVEVRLFGRDDVDLCTLVRREYCNKR
jgi:hypothetical protein